MTSYVLVHGGFTDGWYWGETAALLERQGHRVQVAELPSTGADPATLGTLADDLAEVRRLVSASAEPVVLVGHSSGGMVITELAGDPGVAHRVYVGAFWPERGQTIMEVATVRLDWLVPSEDGSAMRPVDDVEQVAAVLCAGLDPARLPEWSAHSLYSSAADMGTPSTAPDSGHPVTYVVLEKDAVLPPEAQEVMAARADHVERMATSHQPQMVDPAGLAAVLERVPT